MKITVVTLYDDKITDHFVGVVIGKLTKKARRELAKRAEAEIYTGQEQVEDGRYLYFLEIEAVDNYEDLTKLKCIDGLNIDRPSSK